MQAPLVAAQPPLLPPQSDLSPQVRDRLTEAAQDAGLAPWQREFMLGVAQGKPERAAAEPSRPLHGMALRTTGTAADDGGWIAFPVLSARWYHTAIYDPVRDRMVVFGGVGDGYLNEVWALSLAGSPAWSALAPGGSPPSGRVAHTAIYDPVRDRMVVFGGNGAGLVNDVWALSFAGSPAWSELAPAGSPPFARSGHTAIYDPVRDRMVVFGGRGINNGNLNDVWALTLAGSPAWSVLAPAGSPPSARTDHAAIYDPVRDRMVVFGGDDGSYPNFPNDVWTLSLRGSPAWSALAAAGTPPSGRFGHTAIYDPVRDRMVVFGGIDGTYPTDVSVLSLAESPIWSALAPAGSPPSVRTYHTSIYDPVRDRMVVYGGFDGSDTRNDVSALSLAGSPAWIALTPTEGPPSARYGHTAIYDPVRDRMVVFGGPGRNDVWVLSLAGSPAWSALAPAGNPPSERTNHTAIYDPVRDRMVVFGGLGPGLNNDVWALSLAASPAWSALAPVGSPPSGRYQHTAIYDPVRDRMVVFGGIDGSSRNDVWALSLAGSPAWSALAPAASPPSARANHSAIYDPVRDRMVVFGGLGNSSSNDVWALSWADASTGVLASLVSVDAQASRVRLVWYVSGTGGPDAKLYRRTVDSDWTFVDRIAPDGTGYVRYEDAAVTNGTRYGYQLGIIDAGEEVFVGEVWADVPAPNVELAMRGVTPNPSIDGRLRAEFTLHDGSPARLELIDVAGRVLSSKQVGALGPGTHLLDLSEGAAVRPGIYFLRLTQGQHEVRARAAVCK